jgi:hypothetical protein
LSLGNGQVVYFTDKETTVATTRSFFYAFLLQKQSLNDDHVTLQMEHVAFLLILAIK